MPIRKLVIIHFSHISFIQCQYRIKKPKSRLKGNTTAEATGGSADHPKAVGAFSGFGGFGTPSSQSSTGSSTTKGLFSGISFGNFGAPTTQPKADSSKPTDPSFKAIAFGTTSDTNENSSIAATSIPTFTATFAFSFLKPSAESTATSETIAKTIPPTVAPAPSTTGGFGGFGSSNSFSLGSSTKYESTKSENDKTDSNEEDYYKKLRGLNISFKKHIESIIKDDPFGDISESFSQYSKYHKEITDSFDPKSVEKTVITENPKSTTFHFIWCSNCWQSECNKELDFGDSQNEKSSAEDTTSDDKAQDSTKQSLTFGSGTSTKPNPFMSFQATSGFGNKTSDSESSDRKLTFGSSTENTPATSTTALSSTSSLFQNISSKPFSSSSFSSREASIPML